MSLGHSEPTERQISRLRDELIEEHVALPIDGPLGRRLLTELSYARGPRVHESRVPSYGCLLLIGEDDVPETVASRLVAVDATPTRVLRRFADGRRSFLVESPRRVLGLACFDEHVGDERTLVGFVQQSGALVVQRADDGRVTVITESGVTVWDGMRWLQKAHADRVAELVREVLPEADPDVLAGLFELALHWLMPTSVGAILVWSPDEPSDGLDGLETVAPLRGVPVTVTDPLHLPALRSAVSQSDGAVLIAPDGNVLAYGATLLPSREAIEAVPPDRGTRHTSAQRFSHDHPSTVVLVVSEDGPLSLYVRGDRIDLVLT